LSFPDLATFKDGELELTDRAKSDYVLVPDKDKRPSHRGFVFPTKLMEEIAKDAPALRWMNEVIGKGLDGGSIYTNPKASRLHDEMSGGLDGEFCMTKFKRFDRNAIEKTAGHNPLYEGSNSPFAQWAKNVATQHSFVMNETSTKGPQDYSTQVQMMSNPDMTISVSKFGTPDFFEKGSRIFDKNGEDVTTPEAMEREKQMYKEAIVAGTLPETYSYYRPFVGEDAVTFMPSFTYHKGNNRKASIGLFELMGGGPNSFLFNGNYELFDKILASFNKYIVQDAEPRLKALSEVKRYFGGETLNAGSLGRVTRHIKSMANRVLKADDVFYEGTSLPMLFLS